MKKLFFLIGLLVLSGCSLQPKFGASDVTSAKVLEKYNASTEIKAKYALDGVSLTKTEIKNAELDKYKGEPKDEIQVTIGDKVLLGAGETDFKPNIELKRWNEVSFKLRTDTLLANVATKDKTLTFDKDKIKFHTPKMDFEMYDVPATANDEGSYKYIWYLNEKPATNKVEFQIESEGLDFFYQPPLNEENQDPNLTCTETQCTDAEGQVVINRPENVVGSYAVYHSTKGGMNDAYGKDYKTGKAFHIFRPHIIDATGAETWGILHIENGIYSVEIPPEFLDKAVLPIKSNDTFGYTSKGVTDNGWSKNYALGTNYNSTVSGSGSITGMTVYMGALNTVYVSVKAFVTNNSYNILSNGITNAIVAPNVIDGKNDFTFSVNPNISAGNYYPFFIFDTTASFWRDTGTNNLQEDATNSYASPSDPTSPTSYNYIPSIYATYTPSGGSSEYCYHSGGDWYINSDCYVSSSTSTNGIIYIGNEGNLHCIDNAVITAKGIGGRTGRKITGKSGCKFAMYSEYVPHFENGFAYRRSITLNDIVGTLTDFPVSFYGYYDFLKDEAHGGKLKTTNGYDVAFYSDSAGTQLLNFERATHTTALGNVEYHFDIPSAQQNGLAYIFYGKEGASDLSTTTGVWNENFGNVQHFSEQTGNYQDSTRNNVDGVAASVGSRASTTCMGYCPTFNGVNQYIELADSTIWDNFSHTITVLVRKNGACDTVSSGSGGAVVCPIFAKGYGEADQSTNADVTFLGGWNTTNNFAGDFEGYYAQGYYSLNWPITATSTLSVDTTYCETYRFDDNGGTPALGNYDLFTNGELDGFRPTTSRPSITSTHKVGIGNAVQTNGTTRDGYWNGIIDEFRYYKTNMSDEWVSAECRNLINTSTFYTIGNEQTAP